jgi:hypothetical protein
MFRIAANGSIFKLLASFFGRESREIPTFPTKKGLKVYLLGKNRPSPQASILKKFPSVENAGQAV